MTHPCDAPQPGIVIRQRDNLSHWLRQRGMVRRDSHQVARDPGARWWVMVGSDGWIRAERAEGLTGTKPDYIRRKVARAGIRITSAFVMRFKTLPVDS